MPKVSVIIPVYNRPLLLKEALASVKNQTYTDYEIIVVDDGSDADELKEITALCSEMDVSLVKLTHLGCPGRARNRGVELAKGKWLAFLDSDDIWMPHKLEMQVEFFEKNRCYFLVHTREIWDREGQIVSQRKQRHQRVGDIFEDALVKCIIGPSTVMMEKALYHSLGGFSDHIEIAEDYEFWLRFTSQYNCGYIEEPLVLKREGAWDQLSKKYGQIEIFRIRALRGFLGDPSLSEKKRVLACEEYVRKCCIFSKGCHKRGRFEEAFFWKREAQYWRAKSP